MEVRADGYDIANYFTDESEYKNDYLIHVTPITADTVYVSTRVPSDLTVGDLTFSDGTNVKTIKDERAATAIAAGALYTVTNENWESPEAGIPDGALAGVFTVGNGADGIAGTADDVKVYFSQGNLYWDSDSFEFETNQYDTQSSWNASHVSHFFWSKTESVAYAETFNDVSKAGSDVLFTNAETETAKSDFTVNGVTGKYRTLSIEEWQYLFSYDGTASGGGNHDNDIRRGKYKHGVTVCGKTKCLILVPDECLNGYSFDSAKTNYTADDWATAEAAGLVCLPPAGHRNGSDFSNVTYCYYWSSTAKGSSVAYHLYCTSNGYISLIGGDDRKYGSSVRLVTDVSAAPTIPEGFVDLGVKNDENKPLYWAKCNLGATNAWDYGKYFSWGDVKGQTPTDNTFSEEFSWANDVFGQTFNNGISLSDACPNGILAPAYDAATVENPSWRTPTKDEFANLAVNCVWSWCDGDTAKYKGTTVPGYIVYKAKDENDKGKAYIDNTWMRWDASQSGYVTEDDSAATGTYSETDPHIFFPAVGLGFDTGLISAGSGGVYWSSTLNPGDAESAYHLLFSDEDVLPMSSDFRFWGISVRPVSD